VSPHRASYRRGLGRDRRLLLECLEERRLLSLAPAGIANAAALYASAGPDTLTYLDNGTIRLGVNLSKGGAITYLSPSGSSANMINNHDLGRQVQQSYYSGPSDYHPAGTTQHPNWSPFPWNPIQVGDSYGNPGQVLENSNGGGVIYTRSTPMQWSLQNVPDEAVFEQWSRVEGPAVRSHVRLTMQRTDTTLYPRYGQELPAVYSVGTLFRTFSYTGTQPFTSDALTEVPGTWPSTSIRATEGWAALVNNSLWGLGVRHPDAKQFTAGYYTTGNPGTGAEYDDNTGYLAPNHFEILDHNLVYEYDFDLIVGTVNDIRQWVYDHPAGNSQPDDRFDNGRKHWTYTNTSDTGVPVDHLTVSLGASDPYLTGPATAFRAADVGRVLITARYNLQASPVSTTAQFYWETDNVNPFSETQSLRFNIIPDGRWHTYDLNVSASPAWQGLISKLRYDPVGSGRSGETVDIRSISFQSVNEVLVEDNTTYASTIAGHEGENVRLTASETVSSSATLNGLVLDGGAAGVTVTTATGQSLGIDSGSLISKSTGANTLSGGQILLGDSAANVGEGFVYVDGQTIVSATLAERTAGLWFTKGGPGTLWLLRPLDFSGGLSIQDGTLATAASNVLPDLGLTLEGRLRIGDGQGETVGGISGSTAGYGWIELGSAATLQVNTQAGSSDYYGHLTGPASGSLLKSGINNWNYRGSGDFAGVVAVNGGNLQIAGAGAQLLNVARWDVKSGALLLANSSGSVSSNRLDHQVSLQGGEFKISGPADATAVDEVISGPLALDHGRSVVTLDPDTGQTAYGDVAFTAAALARTNRATALIRGDNLGVGSAGVDSRLKFITAPALSHTDGSASTLDEGILPYLVADSTATGNGSDLLTYDPAVGLRIVSAYATSVAGGSKNVRLTADETLTASAAVRGLVLSNSGTAVRLIPGSANQLTVASGAILSTGTTTNYLGSATSNGGTLTFGPNNAVGTEGIFHTRQSLYVYSRIVDNGTQAVSLTKDGSGMLNLLIASTYTGGTFVHQGALAASNSSGSATGPGAVEFFGGTLAGGNTGGTSGFIDGPVTLHSGSTLAPGGTTAILTLRNGLTLDGAALRVDLRGATAGTTYDQVKLTAGNLYLQNGATLAIGDTTGLALSGGEVITLVNNAGSGITVGEFAGLPNGAAITAGGYQFRIYYNGGDGNDIVLVNGADSRSAARLVFYHNSAFDGPGHDGAIATGISALLPGVIATASNYISYDKGLNGLMIDVAGLLPTATPSAADFRFKTGNTSNPATWTTLLTAPSVTVRRGAGVSGSDRLELVWADGTIRNTWLQVTLLANPNTGLPADDVFYFGSSVGDTTGDGRAGYPDLFAIFQHNGQTVTAPNIYDIDGSGSIALPDLFSAFRQMGRSPALNFISVPAAAGTVATYAALGPGPSIPLLDGQAEAMMALLPVTVSRLESSPSQVVKVPAAPTSRAALARDAAWADPQDWYDDSLAGAASAEAPQVLGSRRTIPAVVAARRGGR